jgi:apolipoprotein D and lipocalin family protein
VAGRLYWYGVLPLHALIFRGLPRRIAEHAQPRVEPAHVSTFTYGSIIGASADEVFRWHEQPGALVALTPSRLVRIQRQEGGIRDGGRVTVSIGVASLRTRWVLRHDGYIAGRRFCDEQVRGPFAVWRHAHLFEPIGSSQTLYQDRIEFAVSRHVVLNRIGAAVLRPVLTVAFASRHRTVRAAVSRSHPNIARRWAALVAIAAAMLQPVNARAQAPPVRTVPFVDLDRYAGDWFEIARFENRFQRQCVGDVRASYARRADGRVAVVNRCRTADGQTEARGVARLVDEQTHAKLKVRFAPAWLSWLPPVWGDYWVIGLAPDYSWAVVGDPSREYLWILARTPRLDSESMAAAHTAAQDNGFDVGRLVQTLQGAGRP